MRWRAVACVGQLGCMLSAMPSVAGGMASNVSRERPLIQLEPPTTPRSKPAALQVHTYSSDAVSSAHRASGTGLHDATVGIPAYFTISVAEQKGEPVEKQWSNGHQLFMYVWIANPNEIFIAEVVDNGNGTLTATYESSFPGDYLIYVEEVAVDRHDEGRPIEGSPFSLTVSGPPTIDTGTLPICSSTQDKPTESFWRPGSWISSNIASTRHGTDRHGWIFQPKSCALEAFSYEDLMTLASLEEQTWLLVLGDSVFRGIFLTLVDMVLGKGQKANIKQSVLQKCWGYADVQVGSLRVTYQDMRLYAMADGQDSLVCHDEKLASGGSAAYVRSCKHFLANTIFGNETPWPTVIVAPSHLRKSATSIDVLLEMLPSGWKGRLKFLEHMSAFGNFHWGQENPTMTNFENVGMSYHGRAAHSRDDLGRMDRYTELEPRVSFMSVFPMMQGQLFQNEQGYTYRRYGSTQHYHYVRQSAGDSSLGGTNMVESTITEMLANIMIGEAVGSKAGLYEMADATMGGATTNDEFRMCTDCPRGLIPIHLKSPPELTCVTLNSLNSINGPVGNAWDGSLCPRWCMMKDPVSTIPTESGPVLERRCQSRKYSVPGDDPRARKP